MIFDQPKHFLSNRESLYREIQNKQKKIKLWDDLPLNYNCSKFEKYGLKKNAFKDKMIHYYK